MMLVEGREGVRTGQDKSRDGRETKTSTSLSDKTLAVFFFSFHAHMALSVLCTVLQFLDDLELLKLCVHI